LVKIDFPGFAKIKMEKRRKVAYKILNRKLKTDYTNPTKSGGELYKWHQKQAQLPFIVCLFDVV
jgi:hypothetical protein